MEKAVHEYIPRGACLDIHRVKAPEVLVSGPAGTGKSRACLEKVLAIALAVPGMRALMVRKTLSSFTSTGLVTWREHVAKEAILHGDAKWYGGSPQEPAQYRFKNGSSVVVGGMDKATKIMSSEYDVIYVQEATELTEDEWEALTTRLRNGKVSYQQLMADCNPDAPGHWLKKRCDDGICVMLQSHHEDNPRLFNDDGTKTPEGAVYIERLDRLSGTRYQRLRLGRWVSAEGTIYEEFDPLVHLIKPFRVPKDWPRFWSIDWGYVNPFVCQWWTIDPEGRLIMYRELYQTRRLVEAHADQILTLVTDWKGSDKDTRKDKGLLKWREPKPVRIITDHDVECETTMEREIGLSITRADKAYGVTEGIQAVAQRMQLRSDGRPGIMIMRDCLVEQDEELAKYKKPTCTAEEIGGYVWERTPEGKPNKEQPRKLDDHGCDAKRYFVVDQDLGPRPRVSWL
jgi:phage terminase large subunit